MGKLQILIADDDKEFRKTLSSIFKDEGFEIIEAENGLEAVKAFTDHSPDVVILDLNMPKMTGIEATGKIRAINPAVPIIIISGEGDMLKDIDAITFGAHYYTTKPPDFDRLLTIVNSALGRHRSL